MPLTDHGHEHQCAAAASPAHAGGNENSALPTTARMNAAWHSVLNLLTTDGRAVSGPIQYRYATAPSTMTASRATAAAINQSGTSCRYASVTKTVASNSLSAPDRAPRPIRSASHSAWRESHRRASDKRRNPEQCNGDQQLMARESYGNGRDQQNSDRADDVRDVAQRPGHDS
jgi:hypothetical protein